jgi:hypothetical protein
VTSSTTSNAAIDVQPPCRPGRCADPDPFGFRAARRHLLRWRSSTMTPHRLRRAALHLPPRRPERGPS